MVQSGSNVGVGTTPVLTFDVNGGVRGLGLATGGRGISPDAINTNELFLNGSNAMSVMGTSNVAFAAGALYTKASFFAGGVERMTVDGTTGNVGINNTTPGMKLDVAGGSVRTDSQFISTVATGTAPLSVASTTMVPNLNAAMLGGVAASGFAQLGAANTFTMNQTVNGNVTAISLAGNGIGITNVNAAQLGGLGPSAFAQLGAGTNTFTGGITASAFTGNGAGLTNVNAASLSGTPLAATTPTTAQVLAYNGTAWAPRATIGTAPVKTTASTGAAVGACTNGSQITVTAPAGVAGTVMVRADVVFQLTHTVGQRSEVVPYLGTTTSDCNVANAGNIFISLAPAAPSDTYYFPMSISSRFPVSAGSSNTFFLNGLMTQGAAGSIVFFSAAMDATFVPN
jgi:hypothetical protein